MKHNYIILILTVLSLCLNVYLYFREPLENETKVEEVKKDTIVAWKYSTDTIYTDRIKYKDRIIYDTIHHNDIVYVRDTAVVHRDSTENYTIDISAVKLDWYKLNITHYDTVRYTQTINTVTYKKRSGRPQIGLYGGIGYNVAEKTFGPEIGIGIVIPVTKW